MRDGSIPVFGMNEQENVLMVDFNSVQMGFKKGRGGGRGGGGGGRGGGRYVYRRTHDNAYTHLLTIDDHKLMIFHFSRFWLRAEADKTDVHEVPDP